MLLQLDDWDDRLATGLITVWERQMELKSFWPFQCICFFIHVLKRKLKCWHEEYQCKSVDLPCKLLSPLHCPGYAGPYISLLLLSKRPTKTGHLGHARGAGDRDLGCLVSGVSDEGHITLRLMLIYVRLQISL